MTKLNIEKTSEENLQKLGLTSLQTKIYIALLSSGKESTLTISKTANVDRSNTYRTILRLQNMGLVTRILNTPNLYQAVSMKEAVSTIMNNKRNEYHNLKGVAQELIQTDFTNPKRSQQQEYRFEIIKQKKNMVIKKIIPACENVKESFDLLINKKTFSTGVIGLASDHLKCVRRGIKYRLITEKQDSRFFEKAINVFIIEPNFQLRLISETPQAEIVIEDKKDAFVILNPNSELGERSQLMTDHPGCVEMFQNHFDKVWNQAQECESSNRIVNPKKSKRCNAKALNSCLPYP
jgi:sugar-specific transcriptional regulator TrmB